LASLGLTCREIEAKLGVSKSAVHHWLKNAAAADGRRRTAGGRRKDRGERRAAKRAAIRFDLAIRRKVLMIYSLAGVMRTQRLFCAPFVHERKPLPENELRVCCPRLSVHVYGQFVTRGLRGRIISRLQEMSCVGDSGGSRFFLSGTGAGQNRQRRCALP